MMLQILVSQLDAPAPSQDGMLGYRGRFRSTRCPDPRLHGHAGVPTKDSERTPVVRTTIR